MRDLLAATGSGRARNALLFITVAIFIGANGMYYRHVAKSTAQSLKGTAPQVQVDTATAMSILDIPRGAAVNLPSIRVENDGVRRGIYGGAGDKAHLGGFTAFDVHGVSPAVWRHMIANFGIRSVLDVGCGRGISTSWFVLHGVDTTCVEGSHDAVEKSMVPDSANVVVEHDFSRGPWWPSKTVDAVWCVEFTEHVGRNFHRNYLPAFRKAALIFVTHSRWGGWHHVEVHLDPWWRAKFEMYGFVYSQELTEMVKKEARKEQGSGKLAPDGSKYGAQHITLNMQVFINPQVAALPEHHHLMSEPGCYLGGHGEDRVNVQCGSGKAKDLTALPKEFWPLEIKPDMDKAWEELVKRNIATPDGKGANKTSSSR